MALDSEGRQQHAWYNPGTEIQSFAVAPHAMVRLAKSQSPEIHRRYGTNASFLDVNSSVPPSFHTDQRAGVELAGSLQQVWNAHRELWTFLRATHQGPVLGEGNGHWLWTGWLDGVEAQFGTGWPHNGGMTAPLLVDFDLLRIHPLQLNHGMGYFNRWYDDAPWGNALPMVVLDQYRLQEVAYGHSGFVNSNWNRLPDVWLEAHLLAPVTARHATASVQRIEYEVDGAWVDTTAAVKAGKRDRVRISWDSGLVVVGNSRAEDWEVDGFLLPQFGWLARSPDLLAYTALRDGVIVDFVQTLDHLFANARSLRDWQVDTAPLVARPAVASFEQTDPRRFRVSYQWDALAEVPDGSECVVTWREVMSWANRPWHEWLNQRHAPATPTRAWQVGRQAVDGPHEVALPEALGDGEYLWEIALVAPDNRRLPLDGYCDGQQRVRLGHLSVRDDGQTLAFRPVQDVPPRSAWQTRHLNRDGRVINFGPLSTDGSISLQREGGAWHLHALPRDRPFQLLFDAAAVAQPASVIAEAADGSRQAITPRATGGRWGLEFNGAAVYVWPAAAPPP